MARNALLGFALLALLAGCSSAGDEADTQAADAQLAALRAHNDSLRAAQAATASASATATVAGLNLMGAGIGSAQAVPLLQLYIEGATYNVSTETWELARPIDEPVRLWTIGNVDGPGGKGALGDVRLAIAYESIFAGASFALSSSTTGGHGGFADPSTPVAAVHNGTHTDGSSPTMADGGSLPPHGVYGSGTDWQEFLLGSVTQRLLQDSPVPLFLYH